MLQTLFCRYHLHRAAVLAWSFAVACWFVSPNQSAIAQTDRENPPDTENLVAARCVALEFYVPALDAQTQPLVDSLRAEVRRRTGVAIRVYDLQAQPEAQPRLTQIAAAYRINQPDLPLLYGMNQVAQAQRSSDQCLQSLRRLLQMEVFVREGCSRCTHAKTYLPKLRRQFPALEVQILDVQQTPAANRRFQSLAQQQRVGGVSFPGFWVANRLTIGFDQNTPQRLESSLQRWTYECRVPLLGSVPKSPSTPAPVMRRRPGVPPVAALGLPRMWPVFLSGQVFDAPPPLPIPGGEDDPLGTSEADWPDMLQPLEPESPEMMEQDEIIEVPLFGRLDRRLMGMPLFTFAIGLVDGFNPCAMWVLLFLLSILVNLKDRRKILAVAGTFVVISGLAYFVFMAAWMNVLMLVGFLRWVQVLLATLAIVVGSIHIKDFFAFHKGVSLSIPESAKPGIYARVRKIVMAENVWGAIAGASVLAVLVNLIELLCTAGLPAMYTQILTLQGYPAWKNYAYLALYIVAYMLDDALMVGIVVFTLNKRKLQETQGRWLKLVSGLVVLALGFVLLLRPQWLGS